MEKTSIIKSKYIPWLIQLIIVTLLCVPLLGILKYYGKPLADIELGDPVRLVFSYPDYMRYFEITIYIAIASSFLTYTRKIYGLCLGFCMGGIAFYYLSVTADIEELSKMQLSQTPLEEMIKLTQDGKNFIFWFVTAGVCYGLVLIIECVIFLYRKLLLSRYEKKL